MEESKKVNAEHFKKKIGITTYRVRVHFPQNTKRTFTDSVNTLIMNRIPDGGVIQVDYPDGRSFTARVEHLDDYHFDMGLSLIHI